MAEAPWASEPVDLLAELDSSLEKGLADVLSVFAPGSSGWMLVAGASIVPLIIGQILLAIRGRAATPGSE